MESPVLHLPKLTYPEVRPAEEPVAHASLARARAGGRRSAQLVVAVAVIAGCTFLVMRASAHPDAPERFVAPRPESIGSAQPAPPPTGARAVSGSLGTTSTPGPAFAPATIGPKPAAPKLPVIAPRKSAVADSTPAIEPAPAEVDLSVPSLPQGDSLTSLAKSASDSVALGRILRAVGGTRPAQPVAP